MTSSSVGNLPLPPAIERALTIVTRGRAEGKRVRESVRQLLAWAGTAREPWTASTLTMHGAPIEFGFNSGDPTARYTVEIADPRSDPRRRLRQAVDVLARLGAPALDDSLLRWLESLQADQELRYGCWIGGRSGASADTFKLYAEVPRASSDAALRWLREQLGDLPTVPGPAPWVVMIGHDTRSRRTELYLKAFDLLPTALGPLLRPAGLESQRGAVLDLLQRAYPFSLGSRLPARDVGFSYSVSPTGGPVVFSIYFFCHALFGGDGNARARILDLAAQHGWDFSTYEALTEPLAGAKGSPTCHGMFGVVVAPEAPLAVAVGLSPPAVVTHDVAVGLSPPAVVTHDVAADLHAPMAPTIDAGSSVEPAG